MILTLTLLLYYSAISGIKDGILWSRKGTEAFKWNEHLIFMIERITIGLLPLAYIIIERFTWVDYAAMLISWVLMFSFIHNGFYYETRKRIDVKNYHWFYDSRTSTAWFEIDIITRLLAFIVGILSFSSYLILK